MQADHSPGLSLGHRLSIQTKVRKRTDKSICRRFNLNNNGIHPHFLYIVQQFDILLLLLFHRQTFFDGQSMFNTEAIHTALSSLSGCALAINGTEMTNVPMIKLTRKRTIDF